MSREISGETEQLKPEVMRTPRTVDVEITSRCNLRCSYCYFFDNPDVEYRDLPTEEWMKFFDECGECAVMDVTFQGGEPFMRRDFSTLIQAVVKNRMRFSVLSNGTVIKDETAAFIADTGRCNLVQVSVDGSHPDTHDACRGKGSFVQAIQGIRTLQRHGVPVGVRVTIHKHNVHDLESIACLLLEELALPAFTTNAAGYLGACRQNSGKVLLSTADREEAMDTLLRLSEKYDGRISAQAGPLAETKHWSKMEKARLQQEPPFPNGGHLTGCGCPSDKMAVRADGVMVPCTMLAHMELGRINQDSLREVWQQSPALNRLRHRHTVVLNDFDFCADCPYIHYCTGNCPGLAYSLTGNVDRPSPDACLRQFLADGGTLPDQEVDVHKVVPVRA